MALLFMDGFDLYGASTDLFLGRWSTTTSSGNLSLQTGRYGGQALQITNSTTTNITKALPSTYATLIVGFALKTNLTGSPVTGITFYDTLASSTSQTFVGVQSDGSIVVKRGSSSGTTLATSATGVVTGSTWTHIEIKILFATGATGTYEVRVNGSNVLSGTGVQTAASTASSGAFVLTIGSSAVASQYDDFYVLDTSTSTNNTFLGDTRIETVMPSADTATKNFGTAVTYNGLITSQSVVGVTANQLTLYSIIPAVSGTISSLVAFTTNSSGGSSTARVKGVVYADSSGVPGARLAVSSELVGVPNGSDITLSFPSPPSVVAGTTYYVGFISDTTLTAVSAQTSANYFFKTSLTYSAQPSDPAPSAMSASTNSHRFYAVITSASNNFACVKETAADADLSYVQAAAAGTEDLYSHAALSSTPATINAVQVVSMMRKADAGPRTVSHQLKSGGTDQSGTTWYPGGSYQWFTDLYLTDPATGSAWTGSGVNAATVGVKIIT